MAIALVTGTSSGIGLATTVTLARAGHTVFAGMRNLGRGSELREAVAKEKLPVTIVQLDVDIDSSVEAAIGKVMVDQGRIDVLVNNAGLDAEARAQCSRGTPGAQLRCPVSVPVEPVSGIAKRKLENNSLRLAPHTGPFRPHRLQTGAKRLARTSLTR